MRGPETHVTSCESEPGAYQWLCLYPSGDGTAPYGCILLRSFEGGDAETDPRGFAGTLKTVVGSDNAGR